MVPQTLSEYVLAVKRFLTALGSAKKSTGRRSTVTNAASQNRTSVEVSTFAFNASRVRNFDTH